MVCGLKSNDSLPLTTDYFPKIILTKLLKKKEKKTGYVFKTECILELIQRYIKTNRCAHIWINLYTGVSWLRLLIGSWVGMLSDKLRQCFLLELILFQLGQVLKSHKTPHESVLNPLWYRTLNMSIFIKLYSYKIYETCLGKLKLWLLGCLWMGKLFCHCLPRNHVSLSISLIF